MTTLTNRFAAGIGALALAAGAALAVPATASAAVKCDGTNSAGTCVETTNVISKIDVLDQVPLINDSPYAATMSCSFSGTVSRSLTVSATVSAEVKGKIPFAAEATAGVSASTEVSATASDSATAAGTVRLKPGQSVTCQRIATVLKTDVRSYNYSGTGIFDEKRFTATVPSTIGARIV